MMRIVCLLSVICRLTLVHSTDPLYTITAPNTLRPNVPYQLIVTIHNAPSPVDVKVRLTSDNNNETRLNAEATIASGESKLIQLDVSSLGPGIYQLGVEGSGGIAFNKSSMVSHNAKTFSAFIQTDKAVYKPGQIVHFRVIVTDVALKPFDTNDTNVFIIDNQGNRIKQWMNASFSKGVFSGDLQLSDQVNLGDWHIKVMVKNSQYVKYFTIDEYVLPTFEVEVRPPSFATYDDSKVTITINAKYTYGKPVKGQVLVNVSDYYCKWPCQPYNMQPFSLTTSIDGKAQIAIDFNKDLALPNYIRHDRRFEIFASVTEELTGKQQNATGEITLYNSKYKLAFSDAGNFKPGLKYTTTLQVTLQDGTPARIEDDEEISVEYFSGWNSPKNLLNYTIPQNGEIVVEIVPPDVENLRFSTSFKDARAGSYVNKAKSLSDRYLQLSVLSTDVRVGDEVELTVDSTKELNDPLILQIIGRGKILYWEKIEASKAKSQQVRFKLSADMAPKVRVIVYYATLCGEVVADAVDFSVDGIFKTELTLLANPNSTSPGSHVEVSVSTRPGAYVGLLAVDQSVLLLKTGNDISTKEILDDLQAYEIGQQSYYSYSGGRYLMRPWRPSSPTTIQLFSQVGLIFFTNGLLAYIPSYGGFGFGEGSGVMFEAARPAANFGPQAFVGPAGAPSFARPRPTQIAADHRNELMEPTRIRRHFPETFLWTNATADNDGKVSIEAEAPDTITSFIITAFAMDGENGLGLCQSPSKLRVFRDFFVMLNLPYSIVRGEAVALQAIVFNYLKEDVDTEVTLDNENGDLEFIEFENSVDEETPQHLSKKIKAKAGDGTSVSFLVSAKKLGHIDLKVKARSAVSADAIERKLLVKAEGTTVYFNKAFLIDLRSDSKFEEKVPVDVPRDVVSESEKIEVSAISDVMGSTVSNLDKLLRMPYGCGEQNMLNFVPNIVITEYLTETKQLNEELKCRALKYMETGYQRELTYKRNDYSFSAFGSSDKNGSTWLTAFVVKSFLQAKPYITVDDDVIKNSLNWLARLEADNGSFPEVGQVFHKAMQGGSGEGTSLTAYVLSAFLEAKLRNIDLKMNEADDNKVDSAINKALSFLENQLADSMSDYDLVLTTYVLHLANSSLKDSAFAKMLERSITNKGVTYWSIPLPSANKSDLFSYYNRPRSVDVEMTSYALLTYVLRGNVADAIPIMRWLISKRNENGGFESTQDTVMGIQALAKFAAKLLPPAGFHLNVSVDFEGGKKNFALDKQTALILHREKLPRTTREVHVSATGNGVGIVQISWSYNVLDQNDDNAFTLSTNATGKNNQLEVEACAKYVYEANGESNMAVMEISVPSGYVVDGESLPAIDQTKMIKRVDTKDGDTVVVVYFDKIGNEVCTSVKAQRAFKVAKMKPALVQVYDYYDPLKRAENFYDAPATSMCELCETEACKQKEKCS